MKMTVQTPPPPHRATASLSERRGPVPQHTASTGNTSALTAPDFLWDQVNTEDSAEVESDGED